MGKTFYKFGIFSILRSDPDEDPDPYQAHADPNHCLTETKKVFLRKFPLRQNVYFPPEVFISLCLQHKKSIIKTVFRIRLILIWIRIRILGSVP